MDNNVGKLYRKSKKEQRESEGYGARPAFTIVELLIIVGVIAILATIAIVSYRGITDQARDVALETALTSASKVVRIDSIFDRGSEPEFPEDFTVGDDVVLSLAGSKVKGKICINAYRISEYEVLSMDAAGNGVTSPHLCPGPLIGSPVGGSVPDVPSGVNLVADFSEWELSGAVTYDSNANELVYAGSNGVATSPLVRMTDSTSVTFTYDFFSSLTSPTYHPNTGSLTVASYFGSDGVTPALNSIGYTNNGNAPSSPLNTWSTRSFATPTGPDIHYIRFTASASPGNYTSNQFKIRNPVITKD